jgi:hypothetical protein
MSQLDGGHEMPEAWPQVLMARDNLHSDNGVGAQGANLLAGTSPEG